MTKAQALDSLERACRALEEVRHRLSHALGRPAGGSDDLEDLLRQVKGQASALRAIRVRGGELRQLLEDLADAPNQDHKA